MKKFFGSVSIVAALLSMAPDSALGNTQYNVNVAPNLVFAPEYVPAYYVNSSPDLGPIKPAQIGDNRHVHYYEYGIDEGRLASPAYDPGIYRAMYPELEGLSHRQLLNHWISVGIPEGRIASLAYDPDVYAALNPDIAAALGGDRRQILIHWLTWGLNEGRIASLVYDPIYRVGGGANFARLREVYFYFLGYETPSIRGEPRHASSPLFNIQDYSAHHPDLIPGLGLPPTIDRASSFLYRRILAFHWLKYGLAEGRAASRIFDAEYYRTNHPDLAGLSPRELAIHFLAHGIDEARTASDEFALQHLFVSLTVSSTGSTIRQPYITDPVIDGNPSVLTNRGVLRNYANNADDEPARYSLATIDSTRDRKIDNWEFRLNHSNSRVVIGEGLLENPIPLQQRGRLLDADTLASYFLFDPYPGFQGGVRVAAGDVNGDGVADVITGAGVNGGPHVVVLDGDSGELIHSFFAYNPLFNGGVYVAAGDVNRDGYDDIVVAPGAGGGPHIRVFDGQTAEEIASFFAYSPNFISGVFVAAGDVDGDGHADIITGPGEGGGPHVRVFSGANLQILKEWWAYDPTYTGGVTLAAGDTDGDGRAEVITGMFAGPPHVRVFSGEDNHLLREFIARGIYQDNTFITWITSFFNTGANLGVTDRNGDGLADIIVTPARTIGFDYRQSEWVPNSGNIIRAMAKVKIYRGNSTDNSGEGGTTLFHSFQPGTFVAGYVAPRD